MFPMVHNLFYSWDGWPSQGVFPPEPTASFFDSLNAAWRQDGFVLRAKVWAPDQIQLTFEVEPKFSPVFFAGRVKGRLQHALRKAGIPCEFSRKVAMRALGDNRSGVVEGYLRQQTARAELVDERYRATLRSAGLEDGAIDLSEPAETNSGRYWYNLHLVATTEGRYRIGKEDFLDRVRAGALAWAKEADCRLKALAIMPDHVHLAVRGNPERSPLELAEALWKSLNHAAGCQLMGENVYAGTFSEYEVGLVLRKN